MSMRDRMLGLAKAGRLPRRTVRLRLTLLYGVLFVISGAALLTTTYFLVAAATGNAFIEHTKNGVTIAGFQIGTPPQVSPGQKSDKASSFSAGTFLRAAGSKTSGGRGATAGGSLTRPGPSEVTQAPVSSQQLTTSEKQVARQQAEFETFAHAYQSTELHQLLIESGIGLAIMAVLSVAFGWLMAGRVLRPLRTITSTARTISASNLHERLDLDGPDDELKELGDTIDGLLERLDMSFRSQRQFVANASHELRTPLARQRTIAQVALSDPDASAEALRATHERVLASGEEQEQLIDALLTLSRAQSAAVSRHSIDLSAIARALVATYETEAAGAGLRIRTSFEPAPIEGDPRLAERLVANLLDNAVRHNVWGGTVSVQTGTGSGGTWLVVTNDGLPVGADEVERLYEPFERLGTERRSSREGFGLGLSIVQAVASAHGATLRTAARPKGGLSIEVSFPTPNDPTEEGSQQTAARHGPAIGPSMPRRSDAHASIAYPERA